MRSHNSRFRETAYNKRGLGVIGRQSSSGRPRTQCLEVARMEIRVVVPQEAHAISLPERLAAVGDATAVVGEDCEVLVKTQPQGRQALSQSSVPLSSGSKSRP